MDCNETFGRQSYKVHATCVSEAEKYEGRTHMPKKKRRAQDDWQSLLATCAQLPNAPPEVAPHLPRLAELSNVPRNEKKFLNFMSNSMRIRDGKVALRLWQFLTAERDLARAAHAQEASHAIDEAHVLPGATRVAQAIVAGNVKEQELKLDRAKDAATKAVEASKKPKKRKAEKHLIQSGNKARHDSTPKNKEKRQCVADSPRSGEPKRKKDKTRKQPPGEKSHAEHIFVAGHASKS